MSAARKRSSTKPNPKLRTRGDAGRRGRRSRGSSEAESSKTEAAAKTIGTGSRVLVCKIKPGTVRYIGATAFGDGVWVGVELDRPQGLNDGTVQGKSYFSCAPGHVRFARWHLHSRPHYIGVAGGCTTGCIREARQSGGTVLRPNWSSQTPDAVLTCGTDLLRGSCSRWIDPSCITKAPRTTQSGRRDELEDVQRAGRARRAGAPPRSLALCCDPSCALTHPAMHAPPACYSFT